jgi:hypothetical protein
MPVFFGKALKNVNAKRAADIVEGTDLVRSEIDKARVFASFSTLSIAKRDVVNNISHLYAAHKENKTVILGTPLPNYVKAADMLRIRLPPLCFQVPKTMPKEDLEYLSQLGGDKSKLFDKDLCQVRTYTIENLKKIMEMDVKRDNQCPMNTANISAVVSAITLLRFATMTAEVLGSVADIDNTVPGPLVVPVGVKRHADSTLANNNKIWVSDNMLNTKYTYPLDRRGVDVELDGFDFNWKSEVLNFGILPVPMSDFNPENFNDKTGYGLYFPFIDKLADTDYTIVPKFLWDNWRWHLGDTSEEQSENYDVLCSSWAVLNRTFFGHQFAHLVKCFELASSAQATLGLKITSGSYAGSVILGKNFFVSVAGKVIKPIEKDLLIEELRKGDDHATTLSAIIELANVSVSDDMEESETSFKDQITSMRALSQFLKTATLSREQSDRIIELAGVLNFGESYFGFSVNHIEKVLDWISNPLTEIPLDVPMYHKYLFSSDRIEIAMSAFGETAPTFEIPYGAKINLGSNTSLPSKSNFVTRPVETLRAVMDLKAIIEKRELHNFPVASSKKNKDKSYSKSEKERIWSSIIKVVGVEERVVEASTIKRVGLDKSVVKKVFDF